NKEHAEYLLNWCAFLVQKPDQIPEVAIVLKGAKGTGKGTLGNALMRFFGQHAIQLASVYHLVSNFNAHFRDACFVFADEAFWPGDKSADGTLKRLITEPTLFIEKKGKDGVTTTNRTHLMMASNEEWIIPATPGERRYFVLNVSDHKQQDLEWFGNINKQMEEGGLEAMLY
ncbi:hypothetical protein I3A86_26450, partial [Salmonella enterica]|nr:hypothetical protein [Salmonella enterica]